MCVCVFSVYLRYNGSLCSGMASVGRFKHKSSLGNTDSAAKAQSVQTDIQVHSHNFKSFMAQLVNLGLDPDSNTANINQATVTITRLSSIDGLFLDKDVVTINFMYFSNGACLSHCEHCIDQTANNTSSAKPANILSILTGPVLEADEWRVQILQGMNMTNITSLITKYGLDYYKSNLTTFAKVQFLADSGHYMSRTTYQPHSGGECTMATADADRKLIIWFVF